MNVHRARHAGPGRLVGPLLLLAVLLVAGCQDVGTGDTESAAVTPAASVDAVPQQKFYDYRLVETQAGVRQWILDSDEMYKYADRQDMHLVRVKMDFYRDGEYFSTLLSDSGTAHTRSHDVFVWGNVVITTSDGRRLRTSELNYSNDDGLIRNDVYNVFDRGADVITGIGLEATPDLDYIEIKQEVAAEVGDDSAAEDDRKAGR